MMVMVMVMVMVKVEQSIIECGDEDYGRGRDLMGPSLFLHSHSDDIIYYIYTYLLNIGYGCIYNMRD